MKKSLLLVTLAAAVAALSGCSDSEGSSSGGGNESGATKIYWVASDYSTGELRAAVDTAETALALEVYQDSKVVSFDGAVFVLERMGADNVVRIDPETDEVLYQESLGAGANPYDIVAADDSTALVALNGADKAVFVSGVKNGKADAVVCDLPVLQYFLKTGGSAFASLAGNPLTVEEYGILMGKKKPDMQKAMDKALDNLKRNGTYDKLYEKWFGKGEK